MTNRKYTGELLIEEQNRQVCTFDKGEPLIICHTESKYYMNGNLEGEEIVNTAYQKQIKNN